MLINCAYVTLLSSANYIDAVLVLNLSLRNLKSIYDLHVIVSKDLFSEDKELENKLNLNNISYEILETNFSLPSLISEKVYSKRWLYTFDKLHVFGLTSFSKIVFLDSDMLVVKNIDHLFEKEHLSFATASEQVSGCEDWILPNSGMMVIVPEKGLPEKIFEIWPEVQNKKSDFGDQDLIHAYFADVFKKDQDWRIPAIYNCFVFLIDKIVKERKYNLRIKNPDNLTISVLHFAIKERPWLMSKKEIIKFYGSSFFSGKFHEMKANFLYLLQLSKIRRLNRG